MKQLLPESEWTFHQEAPGSVIVGAWEHMGYRWYEKFPLEGKAPAADAASEPTASEDDAGGTILPADDSGA